MSNVLRGISCLAVLLASLTIYAQQAEPELRAAWVTRFEWPSQNEATCRATITSVMESLAAHNFNAVLFQVRGECSTLYPSPYEPWAPQFGYTDPGWDPVEFAVAEAHRVGLEFHAYINTHTMSSSGALPPAQTTPQHVYNLNGPYDTESWVIHDASGTVAPNTDSYVWIAPGVPQASAHVRRAIMHVVETYDIDGLHFDRIRTPSSEYSHDPISEARFAGVGNPSAEDWGDWMRSQITRDLRKIYGATMLRKPHVKVSAAPFGICRKEPDGYQGTGTQSYYSWYQDSFGWMENHVLDSIYPMIYWDIGSAHPFEVLLADFLKYTGGRHIYPGSVTSRAYIDQVYEARNQAAPGQTIFSWGSVDLDAYLNGPYSLPAPIPDMPWKTNPQTALVVGGTITDSIGNPVTDAVVTISGDSYNYLSGHDGFYAVLDLSPGVYTVSAYKAGVGSAQAEVALAAGDALELDLMLSTAKGVLTFDKEMYELGDNVTITLVDSNLGSEENITVFVESTTESAAEALILAKMEPSVYTGTIALDDNHPAADGILQARRGDTITVTYQDADDGTGSPGVSTATAEVDVYVTVFEETMDSDPGWQADGQWAFGVPTGQAGDHGGPDPVSGHTGSNVYGYNLNGGYADSMTEAEYLTTAPIDCSGGHATKVSFWRWLQVESNLYDQAAFALSNDGGGTWSTIWANPDSTITDSQWVFQEFDLGALADNQTVSFRWSMGPTDGGWNYAGWNIDDFRVRYIPGVDFTETIIDNDEPGFSLEGNWNVSTQGVPYGINKRYTTVADGPTLATCTWSFGGIPAGKYKIEFYVNDNDYAHDAHYYVNEDGASAPGTLVVRSQNYQGDGWNELGEFVFTGGVARVTLTNYWEGGGLYVVGDAMKLSLVELHDNSGLNWILF